MADPEGRRDHDGRECVRHGRGGRIEDSDTPRLAASTNPAPSATGNSAPPIRVDPHPVEQARSPR